MVPRTAVWVLLILDVLISECVRLTCTFVTAWKEELGHPTCLSLPVPVLAAPTPQKTAGTGPEAGRAVGTAGNKLPESY